MTTAKKLARSFDWRSALRELVLIVLGVTIALAGTAWYEGSQDRKDEELVLRQLAAALELDLEHLNEAHNMRAGQAQAVRELRSHIEAGEPLVETLAFGTVLAWFGTRANLAPYEALKSRGLELISNDALRIDLIRYYEDLFPLVENAYLNDRSFVMTEARPYYLVHFRQDFDNDMGVKWSPLDYTEVRADPTFWNLTGTKLQRLELRILPYLDDARSMLTRLINGIEDELETR